MKTNELTGAALDWAVALIEFPAPHYDDDDRLVYVQGVDEFHFSPSTNWSQGGPIIEREVIVLTHPKHDCWTATAQDSTDLDAPLYQEDGPTPLIAAMRCYVASKLGENVEIPEELK